MLNEQSLQDARNLITGKDGQLFITTSGGSNIFLAEVESFTAQLNVSNVDFQPVGSAYSYAVTTGYSVTLSLTEGVIRDDVMLLEVLSDLRDGFVPYFDFQGKLRRRDGQAERMVFRNCVPDGSIDLMNVSPGEVIKRAWTFRVNFPPETLQAFVG